MNGIDDSFPRRDREESDGTKREHHIANAVRRPGLADYGCLHERMPRIS